MIQKYFLFFFLCISIAQCKSQSETSFEVEEIKNLSYISNPSAMDTLQQLNLFLPKGKSDAPLLIWIGGGAWSYVNRHMETDLAQKLAHEGIAVAAVGHRLSSAVWRDSTLTEGVQHPEHIKDIAAATAWLIKNKSKYNFNTDKILIGGFSSGAHLATLISMDPKYLNAHQLTPKTIKGTIAMGGTYDIPDYYDAFKNGSSPHLAEQHVQAVFGNTDAAFLDASPTSYLKNLSAPLLLVSENNTDNYANLFRDAILQTDFKKMKFVHADMGHGDLWRNISYEEKSEHRDMIRDFIFSNVEN